MRINVIMGVFLVVCLIVMAIGISRVHFGLESTKSYYESKLGKYVLLGKDTLQVVDYSIFNETLKLENGNEINQELFEKLQIKK